MLLAGSGNGDGAYRYYSADNARCCCVASLIAGEYPALKAREELETYTFTAI